MLRPTRKGEKPKSYQRIFKPLRQVTESINQTFKSQLDVERHGRRTIAGACAPITQRVLALAGLITRIGFGFNSPEALFALAMLSLGADPPALPSRT